MLYDIISNIPQYYIQSLLISMAIHVVCEVSNSNFVTYSPQSPSFPPLSFFSLMCRILCKSTKLGSIRRRKENSVLRSSEAELKTVSRILIP